MLERRGADLAGLRRLAEQAVRSGGEIIAAHFGVPADFPRSKGPGDYVTATDRASENAIRDILQRGAPGIPIVAEEEGGEPAPTYWCVDPLDGTRNFSIGMPVVAVSVALIVDGRPVVGSVGAPLLGLFFSAARGLGAWAGPNRLNVSSRPVNQAIVATGFPLRDRSLLPGYLPTLEA
ncbi:MAG: inositol monophosphatase, partial [Actinomycetota bacterium]|nr:inositol monophosphatase [Actinomycetota bacterium]